ncbi:hypothetical protein M2432_000334 [Mycobacterium sp. OTB74]|jgi:hypothetical protein|nr:hypothetical protein [Mycobacterium sp. OTB74]
MQAIYDLTVGLCKKSQLQMNTYVAQGLDRGVTIGALRVDMTYVCPGRVNRVDDAVLNVQQGQVVPQVCALPSRARTQDQQLIADTDGCK